MSKTIQLGIGLGRLDDIAANARRAETLGYDFVSVGEHVFFYGPIGNGLISLAAAAGATQNIRLMSTITLVPLYPAALLAKQVATLDVISGGRFNLGVGVGGEFAKEFSAVGVPVKERGARTNEALEVLQLLFNQDEVQFSGQFNQLDGVTLAPKPVQRPLPVWVSGRSDAALRRCARYATGWLPYMYTPEQLHSSVTNIQRYAEEYGRTTPIEPGQFIFFTVHEDREQAIQMAVDRLSKQYNQDFSKLVHKYALAGDPDDCVARLKEYVGAGARTVILNSACPADYTARNEQLLAETVLPAIKALG
ncbi:MAG: LLM class flavin-dependent oxidoreductase [Pseudomonadota bacterium]